KAILEGILEFLFALLQFFYEILQAPILILLLVSHMRPSIIICTKLIANFLNFWVPKILALFRSMCEFFGFFFALASNDIFGICCTIKISTTPACANLVPHGINLGTGNKYKGR